jgi:gliding motility-associated-like protein
VTAGPAATISCITGTASVNASSTTSGVNYNCSGPGVSAGGTTAAATVNIAGTYTVTVTNPSNGCTITSTVAVGVNTPPVANAGSDVTITSGTSTTLTATGGTSYLWSNGEITNPIIVSPPVTTDYCVTATDAQGCSDTACVTVTVDIQCGELFVPTAFSPNGDGSNDVFRIKINPICVKEMSLLIFDRWGEKMIEITDPDQFWDGTYKGKALDNAVFVYYLKITLSNTTETIKQSGNVSLLK